MSNLVLLLLCFALGPLLRRTGRMPETAPPVINAWVIHVALPATIFRHVPRMALDPALVFAAATPWIVFGVTAALVLLLARWRRWTPATTGCLILTAGLGNTSFVGLPMTEAFYGPSAVPMALVADQLGSFLTLSTLGLLAAARFSASDPSPAAMVKRVVSFPPFIALCLAATVGRALLLPSMAEQPWAVAAGPVANEVLRTLSNTLAPLALFSVGFQLRLGDVRARAADVALGLALKLGVAPAVIVAVALALGLDLESMVVRVSIIEAGMAPMITAGIIASEHRLDAPLCGLMVGVGIPVSFLSLPLWVAWLG